VILRVSALVDELPAIAEMDCNPVVVLPEGAFVVDARVRVEEPPPRPPLAAARAG
jgi:acyl-CoA synthetase (NDP forming)